MALDVIVARNAQEAIPHIVRHLMQTGRGMSVNGRARIVVQQPFTVYLEKPSEHVILLPEIQPNPAVRLAAALLTHTQNPNEKLLEEYERDPFWDQLVDFNPQIAFADISGSASMRAELNNREIVSDFLSSDVLQLSIMLELAATKSSLPVGPLAVELTNAFIDIDDHLRLLQAYENGWPLPPAYPAKNVPLISTDLDTWREEAGIAVLPEKPAFGLREPWMRKVAVPLLATFRHYVDGDARWKITLDDIADESWRRAMTCWIDQDREGQKKETRRG